RFADHQAEAREVAADHVVERLVAGMALDVLEQKRRRFLAADKIGDGRGFEIGIDFGGGALELAERLDLVEPEVEIASVGAAQTLRRARRRGRALAARADGDAHVHVDLLRSPRKSNGAKGARQQLRSAVIDPFSSSSRKPEPMNTALWLKRSSS